MKTKTKLEGNSRETCCLLCAGVNGILVEMVHLCDSRTLTACSVSSELGFRHRRLRPFMTGDVNGSSDLRSVPSGLSHARRVHRESRALHESDNKIRIYTNDDDEDLIELFEYYQELLSSNCLELKSF